MSNTRTIHVIDILSIYLPPDPPYQVTFHAVRQNKPAGYLV